MFFICSGVTSIASPLSKSNAFSTPSTYVFLVVLSIHLSALTTAHVLNRLFLFVVCSAFISFVSLLTKFICSLCSSSVISSISFIPSIINSQFSYVFTNTSPCILVNPSLVLLISFNTFCILPVLHQVITALFSNGCTKYVPSSLIPERK